MRQRAGGYPNSKELHAGSTTPGEMRGFSYFAGPSQVQITVMRPPALDEEKGALGKANCLRRRSSHQMPHTSNSPGQPEPPRSNPTTLATQPLPRHPGRHHTQSATPTRRPTNSSHCRTPHAAPPSSQPHSTTTVVPANTRPRCACRSFKLVGACLVLTIPGHPPLWETDPHWIRGTGRRSANTPLAEPSIAISLHLGPASSSAIPAEGSILLCLVKDCLLHQRLPGHVHATTIAVLGLATSPRVCRARQRTGCIIAALQYGWVVRSWQCFRHEA